MTFWLGVLVGLTHGFGAGMILTLFLFEKRVQRAKARAAKSHQEHLWSDTTRPGERR